MSKALPPIKPLSPRGRDAYNGSGRPRTALQTPLTPPEGNARVPTATTTTGTAQSSTIRFLSREVGFSLGPVQDRFLPPYNDLEDPHLAQYWARRELLIRELAERRHELQRQRRLERRRREMLRQRFERRRRRELKDLSAKKGYASQRREIEEEEQERQRSARSHQPHPPQANRSFSGRNRSWGRGYDVSAPNNRPATASCGAITDYSKETPPSQRQTSARKANQESSLHTAVHHRPSKEMPTETKKTAKTDTSAHKKRVNSVKVVAAAKIRAAAAKAAADTLEGGPSEYQSSLNTPIKRKYPQEADTRTEAPAQPKSSKKADVFSNFTASTSSSSLSSSSSSRRFRRNGRRQRNNKYNSNKKNAASARSAKKRAASPLASQEVQAVNVRHATPRYDGYDDDYESETPASAKKRPAVLSSKEFQAVVNARHATPRNDEYDDDYESETPASAKKRPAVLSSQEFRG
ncbi:hypothetical protein TcG_03662, partial [Trypanosoma cruzi]